MNKTFQRAQVLLPEAKLASSLAPLNSTRASECQVTVFPENSSCKFTVRREAVTFYRESEVSPETRSRSRDFQLAMRVHRGSIYRPLPRTFNPGKTKGVVRLTGWKMSKKHQPLSDMRIHHLIDISVSYATEGTYVP